MTRIDVPPGEGRGVRVPAGQRFRVIDVDGNQVADVFAFNADDVNEFHSAEHTRVHVSRLFPRVGEAFVTNQRRPILLLEEDRTPGIHDMLCAACDPARYAGLGVEGHHASCRENLERAMEEFGHTGIAIPQPINLFMNIPIHAESELGWEPAPTRPGDSVELRAEMDLLLVVSACPQDLVPVNGAGPSRLAIELLDD